MDETFGYYGESDDEALDLDESWDEGESYDESWDEAFGLPLPLPGIASGIGNLLGGLFRGGPTRRPLPATRLPSPGPGVSSATLNTPAGAATINLPSALVRQDEFRTMTQRLQEEINRNTGRLNTVTNDVGKLRRDFAAVETDTRKRVANLQKDTRRALAVADKKQAAAITKLRKDQSSQQMTNLMILMMMQSGERKKFDAHKHKATGEVDDSKDDDNTMLMMLPMMMMGDSGSLGGDNAMMMAMMMAMAMSRK